MSGHSSSDLPPPAPEHLATDYVERPRVWDSPRNVRLLIGAFFLGCAGMFAADALLHRHDSFEQSDTTFGPELWFGFYGLYGFVACVVLVLLAKIMRRLLMRGEEYYDA